MLSIKTVHKTGTKEPTTLRHGGQSRSESGRGFASFEQTRVERLRQVPHERLSLYAAAGHIDTAAKYCCTRRTLPRTCASTTAPSTSWPGTSTVARAEAAQTNPLPPKIYRMAHSAPSDDQHADSTGTQFRIVRQHVRADRACSHEHLKSGQSVGSCRSQDSLQERRRQPIPCSMV